MARLGVGTVNNHSHPLYVAPSPSIVCRCLFAYKINYPKPAKKAVQTNGVGLR